MWRSPLLCTACVLAASEYTFVDTGLFLSYKMIARDLLGCTGLVGTVRLFEHFQHPEHFLPVE